MKRRILLTAASYLVATSGFAAPPQSLPPMPPCDIITTVTRFTIPRINIKEPATLREALDFIYLKYRDIDIDPPRERIFVFEYHLPEATLQRHISFEARDVTMIEAIKLALSDTPVALTFEPGRLVFSPPSPPSNASAPQTKP